MAAAKPPQGLESRRVRRVVDAAYIADLLAYSKLLLQGGLAPKGVSRPEQVAALIEVGRDLGLSDTQAIQSVKIVAGRPSIYGDAALALIRDRDALEDFEEGEIRDEAGELVGAFCRSKRRGATRDRRTEFTIADAQRAKLWGKDGTWTEYPKRMLTMRARGFNLRDEFADILCGLITTEEARDMPRVAQAELIEDEEPAAVESRRIGEGTPPQVIEATPTAVEVATNGNTPTPGQPEPAAEPTPEPAASTSTDTPPAADATPDAAPVEAAPEPEPPASPVTAAQLREFGKLYPIVLETDAPNGDDEAQAAAWGNAVFAATGKRSARELTAKEAAQALDVIGEKYRPFVIPKEKKTKS